MGGGTSNLRATGWKNPGRMARAVCRPRVPTRSRWRSSTGFSPTTRRDLPGGSSFATFFDGRIGPRELANGQQATGGQAELGPLWPALQPIRRTGVAPRPRPQGDNVYIGALWSQPPARSKSPGFFRLEP